MRIPNLILGGLWIAIGLFMAIAIIIASVT